VLECTGPDDYSPADIAQAMSEVTGKAVRLQQWPAAAAAAALTQFGVPPPVAALIQELYEGLDSEHVSLASPQTVRRGSTTARAVIAEMWGAVPAV
jgi:uncharacterized protein YbjT (DUF2867 family)